MAKVDLEALKGVTILSICSPEQIARVAAAGETTVHPAGSPLTEEGVMGHRFHLILEGRAVVERQGTTLDTVGPGDFVGEIGLLGGGPATATVRCVESTSCLTIWRQRFWELLEAEPSIALRILEVLCRRLERDAQAAGPKGNLATA